MTASIGRSRHIIVVSLLVFGASIVHAQHTALKPGDVIGPHNWPRVQGMVGDNLLNRIKHGYSFKIKESRPRRNPKAYDEATEKFAAKVALSSGGELLHYIAGQPFSQVSPADPQAGLKLVWNFARRWTGDDYKDGGGTATGRAISHIIEKDGSERRSEAVRYELHTRGRVSVPPQPSFPGYGHVDWMVMRADEYPRDTAGTTTLEVRYIDDNRDDDLHVFIPTLRRARRAPPTERCATIAPTEFNYDDINSFNGKITRFNYKVLGERPMLGNFAKQHLTYLRKSGDYLPLDEAWEVVNTQVLEITPKDPEYCYPRKVLYLDQLTHQAIWVQVFNAKGELWKEQFNLYSMVKLADGQEVISPTSPVIINLQNGRATVFVTARAFNQGYQPSLFTLQTLQSVMRGGSLR
jgi:hypothetical protein